MGAGKEIFRKHCLSRSSVSCYRRGEASVFAFAQNLTSTSFLHRALDGELEAHFSFTFWNWNRFYPQSASTQFLELGNETILVTSGQLVVGQFVLLCGEYIRLCHTFGFSQPLDGCEAADFVVHCIFLLGEPLTRLESLQLLLEFAFFPSFASSSKAAVSCVWAAAVASSTRSITDQSTSGIKVHSLLHT